MRRPVLALVAVLALIALVPAAADARTNIRLGVGDQHASMFDQPAFKSTKLKKVRYFVAWNAMDHPSDLSRAEAFVERANEDGISVLLHISSDDLRLKKAKLPTVRQYRSKVGNLVRYMMGLGVTEFGTWNEANHASQPTYRSPTRAAQYFREMYDIVMPLCSECVIVALDVLDQRGVEAYMRSFYRSLSFTWRRRAKLVGIHNYGDVNRQRTSFTGSIIRQARAFNRSTKFWFTETGGIVAFGKTFPCNASRAARRLNDMFALARKYRSSGVQRIYVYSWTGAGCTARFDSGLTNRDGTPRPALSVLRRQLPNFLR